MRVSGLALLCVVCCFVVAATADDKLDPAVEKLKNSLADKSMDREKLRQEILGLLRNRAGSDAAVQAAGLLPQLPSPLDKLDPKQVPELDRFEWQPKELVAVLGEHRGRQGSLATCVVWTRDGKRVISAGSNALVRIWDAATLRQEAVVSTGNHTTCLAVSRDNKTLAAGNAYGGLYVWDISGKQPVNTLSKQIGTSHIYDVDFSPDNKLLAAGLYDGLVHTFDMDGSKPRERTQLSGHKSPARALRFTPDSKTLAAGAGDGTVRFWSFQGEKINELGSLQAHTGAISCATFNARATSLVLGCEDGHIVRVNMGARFTRSTFIIKTPSNVSGLEFSPGGVLTSSHHDGIVRIWGAATATEPTVTIKGHFGVVSGLAYSPDGKMLATAGHDWTIRQWLVGTRLAERFPLKGHWSHVYQTQFSPDGTILATGSDDRTARLWNLTKSAPAQSAQFNMKSSTAVYTVAFSPDGKLLATGGNHTTAHLWDVVRRSELRAIPGHPSAVNRLFFSPDGQRLLASSHKTVVLWNATTAREVLRFDGHTERVNSMTMSPDGRFVLTGTGYYRYDKGKIVTIGGKYQYDDCSIRLWDLGDGKLRKEVMNLERPVSNVTFTPDGRSFACSLWEHPAHLWEASPDGLKKKQEMKNSSYWSHLIAFTPDGKRMATIGQDYKLRLTEVATDKVLKQWTFNEYIAHFSFSPDSRYLAVSIVTGPVYVLRLDEMK